MKKDSLLQEEINRVKTIMGLTEQSISDADCITQLQDKGYNVANPSNVRDQLSKCRVKPNINCLENVLINSNIDENQYEIQTWPNGECYLMISNTTPREKGMRAINLTFWEDGRLTMVNIFKYHQNWDGKIYNKFLYQGEYTCDIPNNTIKHTNLIYASLRDENNKTMRPVDFDVVDKDGNIRFRTGDFLKTIPVDENDDTFKIINKLK
jgi:hypothetical protein